MFLIHFVLLLSAVSLSLFPNHLTCSLSNLIFIAILSNTQATLALSAVHSIIILCTYKNTKQINWIIYLLLVFSKLLLYKLHKNKRIENLILRCRLLLRSWGSKHSHHEDKRRDSKHHWPNKITEQNHKFLINPNATNRCPIELLVNNPKIFLQINELDSTIFPFSLLYIISQHKYYELCIIQVKNFNFSFQ